MPNGDMQSSLLVSKEVIETDGEDVFNLEVRDDNSYVANGIVVHNCDDLAAANLYGMGEGVYPVGEEPTHPHPNCLCYVIPVVVERDVFVDELSQWLKDPSSQPRIETWYNQVYRNVV